MFWTVLWDILAFIGLGCVFTVFVIAFFAGINAEPKDKNLFSTYFKRKDDNKWP